MASRSRGRRHRRSRAPPADGPGQARTAGAAGSRSVERVRMATEAERTAMARAIELASRGATTTLPNPVVGCVLVGREGEIVGEGWHERRGGPHAEVAALVAA